MAQLIEELGKDNVSPLNRLICTVWNAKTSATTLLIILIV